MDKYTQKVKEDKKYPLHLRNDTFKVEKVENSEKFNYWAKIPVSNMWGGIGMPIKPQHEINEDMKCIIQRLFGRNMVLS